jgi:hypothetical protein
MAKDHVVLKIDSCLVCPHHGVERDPSSDDSFDWMDESLVCYVAKSGKVSGGDAGAWSKPARRIVGYSRNPVSEYKRDGQEIPKWCPLKKGSK